LDNAYEQPALIVDNRSSSTSEEINFLHNKVWLYHCSV